MMSKWWRSPAFALSNLAARFFVCINCALFSPQPFFARVTLCALPPPPWLIRQATTFRKVSSSLKRKRGLWRLPRLLLAQPCQSLCRQCPTPFRLRVEPGLSLTRLQATPHLRCWVLTPAPALLQAGLHLAITTRLLSLRQGVTGLGMGLWLLLPSLPFWSVQGLLMDNSWMDCPSCLRTSGTVFSPSYSPWSSARWSKPAWCWLLRLALLLTRCRSRARVATLRRARFPNAARFLRPKIFALLPVGFPAVTVSVAVL